MTLKNFRNFDEPPKLSVMINNLLYTDTIELNSTINCMIISLISHHKLIKWPDRNVIKADTPISLSRIVYDQVLLESAII